MADFDGVGRGTRGAVQTGIRVMHIVNHRTWLRYLRHEALLRAVNIEGVPADQRLQEVVDILEEVLDETEVPFEPTGGIFGKIKRRLQETISRGIRYPAHEGAARQTFSERLYEWAKKSADTEKGRDVLGRLHFLDRFEEPEHVFAVRMVVATHEVLVEPFYQKGPDKFRMSMADSLNYGLTELQRAERRRQLQVIARAVSSGAAATAVSILGFHSDWLESLGLGAVALTLTGVVDVTAHQSLRHLTESMKAARRQALQWLHTLSSLLVHFAHRTNESLQEGEPGDVEALVKVLAAMASGDVIVGELPGSDELLRGLNYIQNTADRAGDDVLSAALIDIETAIKFELNMLPEAVGKLLNLVQSSAEEPRSHISPYGIPARRRREVEPEEPGPPPLGP